MAGSTFSVFGSDVSIKGNVSAKADLHIDGRVDGDQVGKRQPTGVSALPDGPGRAVIPHRCGVC